MDTTGKRLRLLYPDIHGLERGKYLFGDVAEAGHAAFCIGVYPLTHDREILPVPGTQFDVGLHDIEVHLDRDSLRHSWEPDTLIGIGDATSHGEPVAIDPRRVLRDAVAAWRSLGLEPQISFELEFYLMDPDGDGWWTPVRLPAHRVYGTGTAIDPSGCVDAMVSTALACGFPVESWGSEYDESAYEVNIRYDDAVPAADDAFVFRLLIREIAERHGKLATFLGRPVRDRGGSGMHVNLSFRRPDGSNAFHDPNDDEGLSDLARRCIAGMLEHHAGIAAIVAPHVNAYKRLQPDMLNGYWATWGHDDRSVTVRVPPARGEATRLEHRSADAAANPYLVGAAVLHAARLGVEDDLELAPPQPVGEDANSDVRIPATLADALDALAADDRIVKALGPEVVEAFTILKRGEWERYTAAVDDPTTTEVTDWELRYYLPFH
ncbi:MAG TPA: glutamine synthetase family protein [Actinomycetota bacterium]|nr:glutamine synthetase family protein [Actinomycetota bacterium]